MNLGDIITRLQAADPNQVVKHGFHNPHSYRGDYNELAFEPAEDVTVAEMLEAAGDADGATYEGWKGGHFKMTKWTWCWLSEEGSASGETISPMMLDFMLTSGQAPEPATSMLANDQWSTIYRLVSWLDQQNGRSQEEVGLRILKLAEEQGEVAQAWIGYTGQNPRKGTTHTLDQVAEELVDVIVTAAVALTSISDKPDVFLNTKLEKIASRVNV